MRKTILVTGATDGIGLETVKMLVAFGHKVLIHGRNVSKLEKMAQELSVTNEDNTIESYVADLAHMDQVVSFAREVALNNKKLDVLINNAGVFIAPQTRAEGGLDVRFAVNTVAPYLLTRLLLPLMDNNGRVINLSSAAQTAVDFGALAGGSVFLSDGEAYAQSKLAIIMWSNQMALALGKDGPVVVTVNPRSMLGSKMVQQAYGVKGGDLSIGAEILCRAALSDEFAHATGKYFDNDIGQFSRPHPDALNKEKCERVVNAIDDILEPTIQFSK